MVIIDSLLQSLSPDAFSREVNGKVRLPVVPFSQMSEKQQNKASNAFSLQCGLHCMLKPSHLPPLSSLQNVYVATMFEESSKEEKVCHSLSGMQSPAPMVSPPSAA